jgi:hypothetical protein
MINGKLRYALGDLATLGRAAVVVEDRYSSVFKLDRVRPAMIADGLAELAVRWPTVPVVFAETRQLAEEWTYRYLAAAAVWAAATASSACGPPRASVNTCSRPRAGSSDRSGAAGASRGRQARRHGQQGGYGQADQ